MPPRPRTKPRKKPSQERSRALVDALLQATARILARDGYDRASTNRIAEAAGVSPGSLYQYFGSKEALVAALIDRHRERMNAIFAERVQSSAGAPLREAIDTVVRATLEAHASEPELHRVLSEQVPRVGKLSQLLDDLDGHISVAVTHHLDARKKELRVDDVRTACFVVVHTVQALANRILLRPPRERAAAIDETIDMIRRYLLR